MSEEQLEETAEEQQAGLDEVLSQFPGSPNKAQLDQWKASHGDVFCSGLSGTELFIFRPLNRGEWKDLQMKLQQQQQVDVEASTVETCVLWASEQGLVSLEKKAGTISTLHEQIMQESLFVPPQLASALVIKL